MTKDNGPTPSAKSEVAKKEEETLKFWQKRKIFEESLKKNENGPEYVFYDGPPFANGLPHYGHVLAGTLKDVIPRYQTMRGQLVRRRWGWDCHGLPAENFVEKELGLKSKKDIINYGVDKFNQKARESVMRFADEWRRIIPRLGRWVDMDNDYRTMDWPYIETVWWIFKTLFNRGLIYEGYKSMHICPRCETTLANFEVSQGYNDLTDLAVTVKFELTDEPKTCLLAWTTTAWTLPGNAALAVNPEMTYIKIKIDGDFYILAKDRLTEVLKNKNYEIAKEMKGKDLVGKTYQPLFDYYVDDPKIENKENGWRIYPARFVNLEEGTGVVHIAPAFGEDDMNLGRERNLPFIQHVSMDGKFKSEVKDFAGLAVKPKSNPQETDKKIAGWLKERNLIWAAETITHSYPLCWRCETPLLNYAAGSWFVKVAGFKNQLTKNNQKINWIPEHIKDGRFGKWLEGARDWAISRARFWGAPIPVWRCVRCGKVKVIGSVAEIEESLLGNRNNYWLTRHGQAEKNLTDEIDARPDDRNGLTEKGKNEARAAADKLKEEKIHLIVSSDLRRAKETAEIVAARLDLGRDRIFFDKRLREYNAGDWEGQTWGAYHRAFPALHKLTQAPLGGESLFDLRARMMKVLMELEEKYRGQNILIISHGLPLFFLIAGARGLTTSQILNLSAWGGSFLTGEVKKLNWSALPRGQNFELELHRPTIDEIKFSCSCGGTMKRVPEVFDCWFESGAMPYGQAHYPFTDKTNFDPEKKVGFPADYIAEGVDQTRGWFYSLLVLSTALFDEAAYKNVLVNGIVLAADGEKMAKRLKNYTDPMKIVDQYGADALRFYLLESPVVRGEDLNFTDAHLAETYRRVIARLDHCLTFYLTYTNLASSDERPDHLRRRLASTDILDRWVTIKLNELLAAVSESLDKYELDKAARTVDDFVDNFSTWYIRRSRERFKSGDEKERTAATETTRETLKTLSRIIAPLTPFLAERVYQAVRMPDDPISVHLTAWPESQKAKDGKILLAMRQAREICSRALEARAKAGIKIRQPLASLIIPVKLAADYLALIKSEVNVKEIIIDPQLREPVLDLTLTPELKAEGDVRELIRQIQDLRKEKKFKPADKIILEITAPAGSFFPRYEKDIKHGTNSQEIIWRENSNHKTWPVVSIKLAA